MVAPSLFASFLYSCLQKDRAIPLPLSIAEFRHRRDNTIRGYAIHVNNKIPSMMLGLNNIASITDGQKCVVTIC
jgi:hypothetical protein